MKKDYFQTKSANYDLTAVYYKDMIVLHICVFVILTGFC